MLLLLLAFTLQHKLVQKYPALSELNHFGFMFSDHHSLLVLLTTIVRVISTRLKYTYLVQLPYIFEKWG